MEGILKFPQDNSLLVSPLLERPLLDIWKTAEASVDHSDLKCLYQLRHLLGTGYQGLNKQSPLPLPG